MLGRCKGGRTSVTQADGRFWLKSAQRQPESELSAHKRPIHRHRRPPFYTFLRCRHHHNVLARWYITNGTTMAHSIWGIHASPKKAQWLPLAHASTTARGSPVEYLKPTGPYERIQIAPISSPIQPICFFLQWPTTLTRLVLEVSAT
jgi:hypothetical protein